MNRLIIIGNGFDLAHGLKTSYCDFIRDYLSRSINTFIRTSDYEDPLLRITFKYSNYINNGEFKSTPETALVDLKNLLNHNLVEIKYKSYFLLKTIDIVNEMNWVDLENVYFDHLINTKNGQGIFDSTEVKKLNIEFGFLKSELEQYLLRIENSGQKPVSDEINKIFRSSINKEEIVLKTVQGGQPINILFLNFNYTNTVEKYRQTCKDYIIGSTTINYIHGRLGSKANPIIFGFGDEYDTRYLEFEDLKNKDLLKHIKSFGYFKASNYHNLTRFTNSDDFQVFVLGHSLGLSDRTMLKQIFEHERCKSIKIFYYQKDAEHNDYTEKTMDISSHFTNKGIMRNKIVPYNLSEAMPQLKP